jgi:hypothetical protein
MNNSIPAKANQVFMHTRCRHEESDEIVQLQKEITLNLRLRILLPKDVNLRAGVAFAFLFSPNSSLLNWLAILIFHCLLSSHTSQLHNNQSYQLVCLPIEMCMHLILITLFILEFLGNFWELVSSSSDAEAPSPKTGNSSGGVFLPSRLSVETRLQKLDFDFNSLKVYEEDCRQRLLCEMAENPSKFAPLSNALLEETRFVLYPN